MGRRFSVLAILLTLAWSGRARADYSVGAGDLLDVSVHGQDDLSGKYRVSPDGTVDMPLIGEVTIAGKDVKAIDTFLTDQYRRYLKKPSISVRVAEYNSQKIYVLGAVARPDRYVLKGDKLLLDVLMEAGGPAPGAQMKLHLVRADADGDEVTNEEISLDQLLVKGDLSQNLAVEAGDILYVPPGGSAGDGGVVAEGTNIYVVGEVNKPGLFRLESGATAMAAVLAAGGLTKYASPGRTKVVRGSGEKREVHAVDLPAILKRGRKDKDVALKAGDMVIVPARRF